MRLVSSGSMPAIVRSTDIAVIFVILVSGAGSVSTLAPGSGAHSSFQPGPPSEAYPSLAVSPPSWWMLAGNSTEIWAVWTGVPPGCTGEPLWFRWEVNRGYANGNLSPSEGPSVNFTASAAQSGTARVEVRSALVVDCATTRQVVIRAATSNLTVVTPLELENISLSPNPIAPGDMANLSVDLVNGEPPYRLRIAWGDGGVSFLNATAPGRVSLPHRYPAGSFVPTLSAQDAAGLVAHASVDEAITASAGIAVAVDTPTPIAEVGVPVAFTGVTLHAPIVFGDVSSCTDAVPHRPEHRSAVSAERNFSCTFAAPGVAEVEFDVIPVGAEMPPAPAQLMEPVTPPLGLNVSFSPIAAEAGLPTVIVAQISGGAAPYILAWSVLGNSTQAERTCYADGPVELPVWPSKAGSYAVTVRVTDADGVRLVNSSATLRVDPTLQATATADGVLSPQGASVAVAGTVTSGAPPFQWWVVPALYPSNQSNDNGSLGSVASFGWSGMFAFEGNSSVSVLVMDRYGAAWFTAMAVALVPGLSVSSQVTTSSTGIAGHVFVLNVSLTGGLAPFALNLTTSDHEAWNRTVAMDGSSSWTFPTNDSGRVGLELVVRDGAGIARTADQAVTIPRSNSTPAPVSTELPVGPGNPAWVGVVGIVVLVSSAVAAIVLWRRRQRPARDSAPAPDPVEVVRRIVEPAEGAERSTVELLAEEAGVSPDVVHATVDRLISTGALRAESGPDGEEVLAWSHPG